MNNLPEQGELSGLIWRPFRPPFRLRLNDVIRIGGRLGRVIRVSECAAVVLMNGRTRDFSTRFDKHVRFQPSPVTFRISANAEIEILNRKDREQKKRKRRRSLARKPAANSNGVAKTGLATQPTERRSK